MIARYLLLEGYIFSCHKEYAKLQLFGWKCSSPGVCLGDDLFENLQPNILGLFEKEPTEDCLVMLPNYRNLFFEKLLLAHVWSRGLGWEWPGKEVEFAASLWPGCQRGKASACVRWPGGRWGLTEKIPKPSLSQTMLLVRWRQTSLPDTRALSFCLGWWNCPPGRHKTTVLSS